LLELGYRCNSNPKYIVFDEIQNVAGWELFINKLHRQKKNILLTGSNSRLLSSELATHLTGRQISIELFPFSYAEYLTSQKLDVQNPVITTSKQRLEFENQFMNYLNRGGFPEVINEEIGSRYSQLYLKELYDKIINRDLVQRRKIKNIKALKEIAVHMMSLYSSQFTYQSVKKNSTYLSINTVKNYIDYLQEAYMGFVLDPYSFKIKERISLPKKYYVIDTALVESVVGRTTIDLGKKLENIIFIELKRRGHEIYYLNEPSYEVDFIIREGKEIIELIQVCWSTHDLKTKNREIAAFAKAAKKLNCQKCTLITFNEEANVSADGLNIHIIPAWQWLLTKSHPS
ncbi:MAG: ATP-binding protein, partial [Bdellovibrionales bacterium]